MKCESVSNYFPQTEGVSLWGLPRIVVCYSFSHETFIFSGRKSGVWVHLIRACTTGSAGLASGFHTKSVIFKVWNESVVSQNVRCDWKMKCWKASFVAYFHMKRSVLLVAFGGSESIQFERAPRDRTLGRRRITRNMQFSKFKMRATWIDRLHFNLQKLDKSLSFGGAWEPVTGSDPGAPSNHAKHAIFKV